MLTWYIKVILLSGTAKVYRSSFCKNFISKVEWKIENYIMYNSSVEIAVVY